MVSVLGGVEEDGEEEDPRVCPFPVNAAEPEEEEACLATVLVRPLEGRG